MSSHSSPELASRTIAIVGGGVSGALVATHLLANEAGPRVLLIEPRAEAGRGLAYSTDCPAHLLNVPAANLSAFPDTPGHFLEWARAQLGAQIDPYTFLPRRLYGTYVRGVLEEQALRATPTGRFQHLTSAAEGLRLTPQGAELQLEGGQTVQAALVVLALGNAPPRQLVATDGSSPAGSDRYFGSPWLPGALEQPANEEAILLIGTGLTAVDAVIALRDTGYKGTVHAISRHGHLPHAHPPAGIKPVSILPDPAPSTIRALFALLRQEARQAAEQDLNWRPLIDGLRPHTNALWASLPTAERLRFQRHLRSLWDIHRHRMAPSIAERILTLQREGTLRVQASRFASVKATPDGFEVGLSPRGGGASQTLNVGRIINCTGPESDYRRIASPLVSDLLAQGLAVPGPLGQGLRVTPEGALYQANDTPSDWLFTLGPTKIGTLFETTAVPEIRTQAIQLATELGRRCEATG